MSEPGTRLHELLPYARVFVGDLDESKYKDETILTVLQVTTGILALLGYDKGYASDPTSVHVQLTAKEKALWGKAAAVLLQDPDATKAALEAVSVRTMGVSYSTEGKARFLEATSSKAFEELKSLIRRMGASLVSTVDDLDKDTLPMWWVPFALATLSALLVSRAV